MSTVVAQQHDISGNGGRKWVRLDNGWLVAIARTADLYVRVYVSKNDGLSWEENTAATQNVGVAINSIALASKGNIIYLVIGFSGSKLHLKVFDMVGNRSISNSTISDDNFSLNNCSIAIDPLGASIHFAWNARTSGYPNTDNIRYKSGTIQSDGVPVLNATEQVTVMNSTLGYSQPSITTYKGAPVIVMRSNTGNYAITSCYKVGTTWNYSTIDQSASLAKFMPSIITDKDDVLHAVWHGNSTAAPNEQSIFYCKSFDGGVTWSSFTNVAAGVTGVVTNQLPTITIDRNNPVVMYHHYTRAENTDKISVAMNKFNGSTWSASQIIATVTNIAQVPTPSLLYDPTFSVAFGNIPPVLYVDSDKQSIEYTGSYTKVDEPLFPNLVVNALYSTAGTGARKLTKLANGWFIVGLHDGSDARFYVSKNEGKTFTQLCFDTTLTSVVGGEGLSLVPLGNRVYYIMGDLSTGTDYRYYSNFFDATTVLNIDQKDNGNRQIVDSLQAPVYGCSLAINAQGTALHAVWASKHSSYPNASNMRYATATINSDGSLVWATAMRVTLLNTSGYNMIHPTITVNRNNNPVLMFIESTGTNNGNAVLIYSPDIPTSGSPITNSPNGWGNRFVHQGGTYSQFTPTVVMDKDGTLHAAWCGGDIVSYNHYSVFYAKSTDNGNTWSPALKLVEGITNKYSSKDASITIDRDNNISVLFVYRDLVNDAGKHALAIVKQVGGTWLSLQKLVTIPTNTYQSFAPATLYDPTFRGTFGTFPPTVYMDESKKQVIYAGTYSTNTAPTASLVSPSNNQILYENDVINISGEAYDANKDQSVTVFYQINSEQRKVLAINASLTQITLSKQLTFKNGKIYDGEVALTDTLAEGVPHTLKVWAVDSENGQSATIERTFYVIPNRAPLISVDTIIPAGVVDADKFKVSGTSSDPDANSNVKVTRKINGGNPVEIYNGPGGAWEFDVLLAELVVGENTIIVEVIDNYGAKTSKTIKLKKNEVKTPILHAVGRYKIKPPAGSAKGVLLFVERDEDMDLKVEISMTLAGEQEQYETLTANNTAPMPTNGIVEDTFYYETTEPKDNIILKISTTRPNATINHKIHLISGAIE